MSLAMGLMDTRRRMASVAPPAAPVATAATNQGTDAITANWNAVVGATSYRLDVAYDAAFTIFGDDTQNIDTGNVTSFQVNSLNSSTDFWIRVRAVNAGGTSANSNVITTRTLSSLLESIEQYFKLDEATGQPRQSAVPGGRTLSQSDPTNADPGIINNGVSPLGTEWLFDPLANGPYVTFGDHDLTVCFWVYDTGNSDACIVGVWDNSVYSSGQWMVKSESSQCYLSYVDSGGSPVDLSIDGLAGDGWDFISFIYRIEDDSFEVFHNAVSGGGPNFVGLNMAPDDFCQFSIGASNQGNNHFENGVIDEVGIWSRALTGAELLTLYNSGSGRQYPFTGT